MTYKIMKFREDIANAINQANLPPIVIQMVLQEYQNKLAPMINTLYEQEKEQIESEQKEVGEENEQTE